MNGTLLKCNDLGVFGSVGQSAQERKFDPLRKWPTLPVVNSHHLEGKTLTSTGKSGGKSENSNLVPGLFS